MKKLLLLIAGGLLISSVSFAQNAQTIRELGGSPNREVTDLLCPEGSLYAQTPDGLDGHSYINGYYFSDNVITAPSGPVTTLTWWMLEMYADPNLAFEIYIQSNNGGQPGAIIASDLNPVVTVTNTGEFSYGYAVMQYTYTFSSPVNISAGDWVGIKDLPDSYHHHYWATSSNGDNYMWLGGGYSIAYDLAFCLGSNGPIPETPVSNWALLIGLGLIVTFTIVRFRKIS